MIYLVTSRIHDWRGQSDTPLFQAELTAEEVRRELGWLLWTTDTKVTVEAITGGITLFSSTDSEGTRRTVSIVKKEEIET